MYTFLTCKIIHQPSYNIIFQCPSILGLSKDFIPLLQCMLGNDYISHMHFKYFLSQLNFRYSSDRKSPVSKRLAVLIKWCRGQRCLESALGKVGNLLKTILCPEKLCVPAFFMYIIAHISMCNDAALV